MYVMLGCVTQRLHMEETENLRGLSTQLVLVLSLPLYPLGYASILTRAFRIDCIGFEHSPDFSRACEIRNLRDSLRLRDETPALCRIRDQMSDC